MDDYNIPKISRVKRFFRPLSVKILSIIMAVLLIAIAALTSLVVDKEKNVTEASAMIDKTEILLSSTAEQLSNLQESYNELEKELSSQKSTASRDKKKLESKIEKLEEQNKKYKKQIEESKTTSSQTSKKEKNVKKVKYPTVSTPIKNNGKKICYLTFDDGPSSNTLKILKILDTYGIKATFFVTCSSTANPKYIKNIKDSGNAIALHTASHNYSQIYKSEKSYFADLEKISDTVVKYAGIESKVVRFPGGSSNTVADISMKKLAAALQKKGYEYFDWNVDSGDASGNNVPASRLLSNVKNAVGTKERVCLLMHDTAAKDTTVQALPSIIEWLTKKGYRFEVLTTETQGFKHNI